jgi:hypothetical protein
MKGEWPVPVTVSYDLQLADPNQRNYIRSMFERFGWRRMGGSVMRYDGRRDANGILEEDWLNDVVPAIMYFRSYVLNNGINVIFFTLDSNSVSRIDFSDPGWQYGVPPLPGNALDLQTPTNQQSSERRIRDFVDAATGSA